MPSEIIDLIKRAVDDHESILTIHMTYTEGPFCCIVTEPIASAGTLASRVAMKTYHRREYNAWRTVCQLSKILSFLHSQGSGPVLARGLTPQSLQGVWTWSELQKAMTF